MHDLFPEVRFPEVFFFETRLVVLRFPDVFFFETRLVILRFPDVFFFETRLGVLRFPEPLFLTQRFVPLYVVSTIHVFPSFPVLVVPTE
jgi:hypothetical protein